MNKLLLSGVLAAIVVTSLPISVAQAANVKVINRLKVACTLQSADWSIPIDAKSEKATTIDDELGLGLKAVCDDTGLDKNEVECKLLIGGTGGSGQGKDEAYAFKYVREVHVFAQVGQFLVCSSI